MRKWDSASHDGIRFEERQVDLRPRHGKWTILTYRTWSMTQLCDIDVRQCKFLSRFKHPCVSSIVSRLISDTHDWMGSESRGIMRISSDFYVADDQLTFTGATAYSQIIIDTLKVLFSYVEIVAWMHMRKETKDHHFKWILDESDLPLLEIDEPQTSIHNTLLDINSNGVEAFLRIMRIPGWSEGGTDFMFEKYIQVVLALLFEPEDLLSLGCMGEYNAQRSTSNKHQLPLIISGESLEWDVAAQEEFASYARATLVALVKLSPQHDPLPEHCIVYGIHCANYKLRVIAHFPLNVEGDDSGQWEFAQVVAAEHWISIMKLPQRLSHHDDDTFIHRWRLAITLWTIRRQVQHLESILNINFHASVDGAPETFDEREVISNSIAPGTTFAQLQLYWRSSTLSVPESWISPEQVTIQLPKEKDVDYSWEQDPLRHLPAMLSSLVLHPLRKLLTPMDDREMWERHISPDFRGPDFVHWLHIPRTRPEWGVKPPTENNLSSEPHLIRCYDFLMMATRSWDEINIFIANVFANFADYSVIWHPFAMYSTDGAERLHATDYRHGDLVMDFALSVRSVAAFTVFSIERAPRLPLTSCSPAALVGLRTVNMTESGQHISNNELSAMKDLMAVHLRPIRSALTHVEGNDSENGSEWSTVMCTYLKRGFVHLLAFSAQGGNGQFTVGVELIDSLPINMKVEDLYIAELEHRMRLVIALFTLQKHVVRFASHWHAIVLPGELMDDEHEAVVEMTGLCSPTISDGVSLDSE